MSKIHAVIATALVVGLSSTAAMADTRVSFHADARATVTLPNVSIRVATAPSPVIIRDHRTQDSGRDQNFGRSGYDDRFEQRPTREQFINVAGNYSSNYGNVTLRQVGNRITGSYIVTEGQYHGTIEGTVDNGVIRYYFSQPGQQGTGVWYVNSHSDRISGTWGTNGSTTNGGAWNLFER